MLEVGSSAPYPNILNGWSLKLENERKALITAHFQQILSAIICI